MVYCQTAWYFIILYVTLSNSILDTNSCFRYQGSHLFTFSQHHFDTINTKISQLVIIYFRRRWSKNWLLVKLICFAMHSTEMVMVKWWCVLLENKWQCIRWLLICFPTMLGGQYRCNSSTYNFSLRRKDTFIYNFHDL